MNKRILALSIICFCTLLPFTATQALSRTLYVNGTTGKNKKSWGYKPVRPFRTISYAVKRSNGSVTVKVAPGTYNENITIDKILNLSLQGAGAASTIIQGSYGGDATILVRGPNKVTISDFTIMGGRAGIYGVFNATLIIRNTVVQDNNLQGIAVTLSSSAVLDQCTIQSNNVDGILVEEANAIVTNSQISDNGNCGIVVTAGGHATIGIAKGAVGPNTIQFNGQDGIRVSNGATALIHGNTIEENERDGIRVLESTVSLVGANDIASNDGHGVMVATGGKLFQGPGRPSPDHDMIQNNFSDGIFAAVNATLNIMDASILNNGGNGISLRTQSALRILNSEISGNANHGIFLAADSGLILDEEQPVVISDNGYWDIQCADEESSYFGNTSGVEDQPIHCSGF